MDDKTIEAMKRVVEEKKLKSSQQGGPTKAMQKIGEKRKKNEFASTCLQLLKPHAVCQTKGCLRIRPAQVV